MIVKITRSAWIALVMLTLAAALETVNADEPSHSGVSPAAESTPERETNTNEKARDALQSVIGAAIFEADWIAAPDVSDGADGLGPLFNAVSCRSCHRSSPSLGAKSDTGASLSVTVPAVLRIGRKVDAGSPNSARAHSRDALPPDQDYGRQLQDRAIEGHQPEGRLALRWNLSKATLPDGTEIPLRRPVAFIDEPAFGPPSAATVYSLRRPLPIEGLGVIAAIEEDALAAHADPEDRDGDGIRGRMAHEVDRETGNRRVARFGWKASAVSLAQQTAEAFNLDMGLSSPLVPKHAGDCTAAQRACQVAPNGGSSLKSGYEVSAREIELIVRYLESIPPPRETSQSAHADGRRHFHDIGCAGCHLPSHGASTTAVPRGPVGQAPLYYSDLLLHDMGAGLADELAEATASGREWRTQPLWGMSKRLAEIRQGTIDGLLHDGRARNIEEAILWHQGEAQAARERFERLSKQQRNSLLEFLAGL